MQRIRGKGKMWDLLLRATTVILFAFAFLYLSPIKSSAGELLKIEKNDRIEVEKLVGNMSMEEKIGQMFIVGFDGTEAKGDIRNLVQTNHMGGVILYQRNIKNLRDIGKDASEIPRSVAELTNSLQDLLSGMTGGNKIPLFIAADQENGKCLIVERGITIFPGSMSLGQTRSEDLTFKAGKVTGEELRAMGINMNLAPVVDVVTNPRNYIIGTRSFGGNTKIVEKLGTQFMKGLHEGGVVAVGKHFPGHGDTERDPHTYLPVVKRTEDDIMQLWLPPFKSLIENGVEAIMSAHIEVPILHLQKGESISLSKDVIEKWLRSKSGEVAVGTKLVGLGLGDKIAMTDDLTAMKAATGKGKVTDTIKKAIKAGNDIILLSRFAPTTPLAIKDFTEVLKELAEEYNNPDGVNRINQSVKRILLLKKRIEKTFNLGNWRVEPGRLEPGSNKYILRSESSRDLAQEIAEKSIVLVTEKGNPVQDISLTQFSEKNGPLKGVQKDEKILVVSSVYYPPDLLYTQLKAEGRHEIVSIKLIYGYKDTNEDKQKCKEIWGEELPNWTKEEVIKNKVKEILGKFKDGGIKRENPIIFSIADENSVKVLKSLLENHAADDNQIIVVGLSEPYRISQDILNLPNVSFLSAASGVEPSIKAIVDALYGKMKWGPPHAIDYISVSVGTEGEGVWVDRGRSIGAEIIPRETPTPAVRKKPPIPPDDRWSLLQWASLVSIAVIVLIAVLIIFRRKYAFPGLTKKANSHRNVLSKHMAGTVMPHTLPDSRPDMFDVFLSHNSKDKPEVKRLGEALKKRGLTVWLDEWELQPGLTWMNALEDIITICKSAAVCVGAQGIGPWEEPEMQALLHRFVNEKKSGNIIPIIPILLPGAPDNVKLPVFLEAYTWVDLRPGFKKEGLDRVQWGITGVKPAP